MAMWSLPRDALRFQRMPQERECQCRTAVARDRKTTTERTGPTYSNADNTYPLSVCQKSVIHDCDGLTLVGSRAYSILSQSHRPL